MGAELDTLIRGLRWVQNTGCRWVALLPDVAETFDGLETRWSARLQGYFNQYGIAGRILSDESFKVEGRFPTGGPRSRQVAVAVFKAYQCRIYGVEVPIRGTKTFVGMEIRTDKKRNKADQAQLRRVARNSSPFWE